MTRDEFLNRCGLVYDAGLATPERLGLLERWVETMLRQGHCLIHPDRPDNQAVYVADALTLEKARLESHRSAEGRPLTLASDADGYALMQLAAILVHPCQVCGTDPHAWWTRPGFCEHRDRTTLPERSETG